jgi:hypothetical protein
MIIKYIKEDIVDSLMALFVLLRGIINVQSFDLTKWILMCLKIWYIFAMI